MPDIKYFRIQLLFCIEGVSRIHFSVSVGFAYNMCVLNNYASELKLRSHAHRVWALYKTALRMIESYYGPPRTVVRYHQVLLRKRFDDNKCVSDPKEQRRLLWLGEHEAFMKKNPVFHGKFSKTLGRAGGVAHERVVEPPDWVMDYWHPLEKARYPEYFKTRECRKCEYITKWQAGIL